MWIKINISYCKKSLRQSSGVPSDVVRYWKWSKFMLAICLLRY